MRSTAKGTVDQVVRREVFAIDAQSVLVPLRDFEIRSRHAVAADAFDCVDSDTSRMEHC